MKVEISLLLLVRLVIFIDRVDRDSEYNPRDDGLIDMIKKDILSVYNK